jgi:cytoskeletal protein RodZ
LPLLFELVYRIIKLLNMRAFTALLVLAFAAVAFAQENEPDTPSDPTTPSSSASPSASTPASSATPSSSAPSDSAPTPAPANGTDSETPAGGDDADDASDNNDSEPSAAAGLIADRFSVFLAGSAVAAGAVYQMI